VEVSSLANKLAVSAFSSTMSSFHWFFVLNSQPAAAAAAAVNL
jgi:hypothetical protein